MTDEQPSNPPSLHDSGGKLTPLMLNHAAWVTHDVEATADFYMRIMGMDLASTVLDDNVPSTGDDFPFFHIFFRMRDGSTLAFFESPDLPPRSASSHPAYDIFDHIALQAGSREEVDRWKDWLIENGVSVLGPVTHDGLIYSIYFRDPNNLRLEITYPTDPAWNRHSEKAKTHLDAWCSAKRKAVAEKAAVSDALRAVIKADRSK